MRLSATLEASLASAIRDARSGRHEFLGIEHVLYALLEDDSVVDVLRACGADVDRLRRELRAWIDEHLEKLPAGKDGPPQQTLGFQRVLQRAAAHVQSAGREEIDGRDILVAIFREPDSQAAYLLAKQGISRLDVVSYISHGIAKVPEADEPMPDESDDDEDEER
ncbi:MAG TPA: Clp protease N-terminal domain-containing protein, partial [Candidatus Binatia bacterium]|nr:Clp protease N-terminal domain-containing protein [Candidatus Binatia bacterium]